MAKPYVEGFRNILRRIKADTNIERYQSIFTQTTNDDEKRLRELCQKFWPKRYSDRDVDIDEYIASDGIDERIAQKNIAEITCILDKLGWD